MTRHFTRIAGAPAALLAAALLLAPASAQDETPAAPEQEKDVIVIYGESGAPRDEAMAAFMRGDYEVAEMEFGENLRCARRVEMMEDFAAEQQRGNQVTADAGGGAGASGAADLNTGRTQSGLSTARQRDADDIAERSCDKPAYQVYMIAMSQMKQGNIVEAKENFYRVIAMSNDPRFFDAHYRLALIELLDDNVEEARERLETLKVLQQRCQRQGERCDYREEIDEAVAFVEGALEARAS